MFIGPGCSVGCLPVGLLAAAWNIPIVSYGCTNDLLSDKVAYPTFSRTVGIALEKAFIIYELAKVFDWNRVAILSDSPKHSINTAQQLDLLLKADGKALSSRGREGELIRWGS